MPWPQAVLALLLTLVLVLAPGTRRAAAEPAAAEPAAGGGKRPNFVWLLSEDNSIHYLRLYGNPLGITPRIEGLAEQGVTFRHAFSCSPVCSVARTTLMSGMYAPRAGFQFHRHLRAARLPDGGQLFPALLKQAGYHTSNNHKKDYNVQEGDVWDVSSPRASWRNRPTAETPFFHMRSFPVTHESSLHFPPAAMQTELPDTSPDQVRLPPYHPDTPTFRYTHARYLDRMRALDREVGQVLDELRQDGLLEDTFVFYFGDHGGVLPRSKGYVYESGLHVPLVVRIPARWRDRLDRAAGSRAEGFVSFVDFGPTVLHLAGLQVPDSMDGQPFLGAGIEAAEVDRRDEAWGYADRFDEKYDLCRSLRKGRYKYIRNYQPFYPDALRNNYRYQMQAYAEWWDLHRRGQLEGAPRQFFQAKPVEALFDLEMDPHEVRNLAGDPAWSELLAELRGRLTEQLKSWPDLSFYPESHLIDSALPDAAAFGQDHADELASLIDTADLALRPFEQARGALEARLRSDDRWQRYWGLIVCSSFGRRAAPFTEPAIQLLKDPEPLVRVRAAEFLGLTGQADPWPTLQDVLATSDSSTVALLTLNTVVFLRDHTEAGGRAPMDLRVRSPSPLVKRRLEYLRAQ